MHPCLQTDDIVRLICAEATYGSLAALACTARTFHPHALDFLWQSQSSIKPLLQCFPSDLWEYRLATQLEGEKRMVTEHLHARRAIKPSDWHRVNLYAPRIRCLALPKAPEIDVEFMQALQAASGRNPLLPQLNCLSWKITSEVMFPFLDLFLSPSITVLLLWPKHSPALTAFLRRLKMALPNLSRVSIYPPENPEGADTLASVACGAICQYQTLQSVNLPGIDPAYASQLATMPNLQRLCLEYVEDADPQSLEGFPNGGFLALSSLSLSAQGITLAPALFRAVSAAPLKRITIAHVRTPTMEQWAELYSVLRPCDSLCAVEITQVWPDFSGPLPAPLSPKLLRPLLASPNMTTLILCSAGDFDIDDETLRWMAQSWPNLKHLSLTTPNLMSPLVPRATLDSLAPFVAHCPELEHLEYRLDARIRPKFKQTAETRIWNDGLTALHFLDSPVANPDTVAAFLLNLFLSLETIYISSPLNSDEESSFAGWFKLCNDVVAALSYKRRRAFGALPIDFISLFTSRIMAKNVSSTWNVFLYLLAIILPPVSVFLKRGLLAGLIF
ncbi:hypothetical protein C8R46DRAFT_1358121 [Mycena filopes]|nr:hypothetical protein C8R46DRAFT_1358121 [Mycena filopes]